MFNMSILRTYDQQQSCRPLVNSRINQFLANCVPAADQDLLQVINVIDFLTVDARRFHVVGNSAIIRSTFQPFRCVVPLLAVDLQQSMAALFTHG